MARGEPLHIRKIIETAGGGSVTTVQEELAALTGVAVVRKSLLIGRGATTVQARVVALEDAIDAGLQREETLKAQVAVLQKALSDAQANVEKLIWRHEDSQRELLQGVDDLRQMVRAGRESKAALTGPGTEVPKVVPNSDTDYWKARAEQAIAAMDKSAKRVRELELRLHELGHDI